MRAPTDRRELYRWWKTTLEAIGQYRSLREAVDNGVKIPPIPDDPQCGFYRRRMVRQGSFVEARIFLEQTLNARGELAADEVLKCQIGEDFYHPADQWLYLQNRPISQDEYRFGVGHRRYLSEQPQSVPDPEIVIDFMTAPPPMFKTKKARGLANGKRRTGAGRAAGGTRA